MAFEPESKAGVDALVLAFLVSFPNLSIVGYYLVNSGMSLAALCFLLGLYYRKTVRLHRYWMLSGVSLVFISAVVLVVAIYVFHGGDRVAAGFVSVVSPWLILAHRVLAVFSVLLMLGMLITGLRRNRLWHVRMSGLFVVIYSIVYISGLFFFRNA